MPSILATTISLASSAVAAGEIAKAGPGCIDQDYSEKLYTRRDVNGDIEGFGLMVDAGIAGKSCRIFLIGELVTVDASGLFELSCVRPDGENRCFWVLPSMVER